MSVEKMQVPVSIIGCGPIGLTGALLLSRQGIRTLILDRRSEVNTHPRSRFVDTNTMELMRYLGIEKEVEVTGLPHDWTETIRWSSALSEEPFAMVTSPTFIREPRDSSPCIPVMTAQDLVERELMKLAEADPNVDMRFHQEVTSLVQDDDGTTLVMRNVDTGAEVEVRAGYTIGADGPGSQTRAVIDSELEAEPRNVNMQDVIFEADFSKYVEGKKGTLLYCIGPTGALIFQPLDGKRRWRCQISVPDGQILSEDETKLRILGALGTEDDAPMTIKSTGMWVPTPGCTTRFSKGRVFLAGDAAHISVPTGGMGNNTGFAGIRNLAWKLAFVIKGVSPPGILATYDVEHRPLALRRIAVGVQTTEFMTDMIRGFVMGEDITDASAKTQQYADYDGVLLSFELQSDLLAEEDTPPPAVDNEVRDFVPCVRSGRRAPHVWLDDENKQSILDWFGDGYCLVLGKDVDDGFLRSQIDALQNSGFPIEMQALSKDSEIYGSDEVVLVRPDGVIADHWLVSAQDQEGRLRAHLPIA